MSAAKRQTNSKATKKQQLETDGISDFVLELYHKQRIKADTNWIISTSRLNEEFNRHLKTTQNKSFWKTKLQGLKEPISIESLLRQSGFLTDSRVGENNVRFKDDVVLKYKQRKQKNFRKQEGNWELSCDDQKGKNNNSYLYEVDESFPKSDLEFQGSQNYHRSSFEPKQNTCFICQKNFMDMKQYENHVNFHSDESDFESLKTWNKNTAPTFNIFYEFCKNGKMYRFCLSTQIPNIIIEKIIIVQTRFMYYVKNDGVPFALSPDMADVFYIDYRLFTKFLEQPIVIIFHQKGSEKIRRCEQYHLMRNCMIPSAGKSKVEEYLPSMKKLRFIHNLDCYLPSEDLRKAFKKTKTSKVDSLKALSKDFKDYFENGLKLTSENICEALRMMLQVEDLGNLQKYSSLRRQKVELRVINKEFTLKFFNSIANVLSPCDEVLIVTENPNDSIECLRRERLWSLLLRNSKDIMKDNSGQQIYMGHVDHFYNGRVTFTCNQPLPRKNLYTLIFRPARFVLRYQYRALVLLNKLDVAVKNRIFFPVIDDKNGKLDDLTQSFGKLNLNDRNISNNPEQLEAVQTILNLNGYAVPYIVYGPPGTGKTAIIVEAILQLYLHRPNAKILVTAGSNYALDEIAIRLIRVLQTLPDHETKKAIVRIFSRSYEEYIDGTDRLLLNYSNMCRDHFYPSIDVVHEYRIVVCTLSIAAKLQLGGFGEKQNSSLFSHVFVDEAPSSTECETIMGVMCTLSAETNLIISGDTKQLGTILRSEVARRIGLGVSLMERLQERDCYKLDENGTYNHDIQIRLRRNYRAHPAIVNLYNELYYNNELLALAPIEQVSLCEKWHKIPNSQYPIIFHSVYGEENCGEYSKSFRNDNEIDVIMDYVEELLCFGIDGNKIQEDDIGIITPYKDQFMRIQEDLQRLAWHNIKCGSIESFQGKEKTIILISFVRTNEKRKIGFLNDTRRLNTALSRAKSLLILIGDPVTLSVNPYYGIVIEKCRDNNTLVGQKYEKPLPKHSNVDETDKKDTSAAVDKGTMTKI